MPGRSSGNPGGRQKGVVSLKATLSRAPTRTEADAIARRLIADAKAGNGAATTKLPLNHLPADDPSADPLAAWLGRF